MTARSGEPVLADEISIDPETSHPWRLAEAQVG